VHAVGGDWRRAAADLVNYETGEGRLRRLRVPIAGGAFELIDDSFNAEQASMIANFEVLSLAQPGPGGRRIAVLGQIGGLTNPETTHAELAAPILRSGVDRVLTLGDDLIHLRQELPEHMLGAHAENAQQLAAAVLAEVRPGDVVSAKGCSITAKFDRVVRHLRAGAASAARSALSVEVPAAPATGNGSVALTIVEAAERRPDILVRSRYRIDIGFLGDTYFGESYQRQRAKKGKTNYLREHGYAYSLKYLEGPLNRADLVIANLEAPLVERTLTPPAGKTRWIHGGKPEATARALLRSNIGAVALANNHSIDYGTVGLAQTASFLDTYGICRFGAGANRTEAERPLRIGAGLRNLSLGLTVFSAFHYVKRYERDLKAYATDDRGGVACVSVELLEAITELKRAHPEQFVVVFPHWGENYEWRSDAQVEMADWLFAAGADLIIGHGAHVMQEIERRSDRWVLYSLGNFVFNSDGRHEQSGAPPYSLVARLRLTPDAERIEKALYLYPIVSNNQTTLFRPRFVDANEFGTVMQLLTDRNTELGTSELVTTGHDQQGWYIRLAFDKASDR
jgi:poly-gamma-glutamate capsule biosynthesis protein CapA/YwtB (metallophosphatase superfamily)